MSPNLFSIIHILQSIFNNSETLVQNLVLAYKMNSATRFDLLKA
uniref:Uncharacterized protein n=1 Tax=Arundo donax TaxID=35708 RepID=A0A0A8ZCY1_ARUDO